jgi:hypothetical protein
MTAGTRRFQPIEADDACDKCFTNSVASGRCNMTIEGRNCRVQQSGNESGGRLGRREMRDGASYRGMLEHESGWHSSAKSLVATQQRRFYRAYRGECR